MEEVSHIESHKGVSGASTGSREINAARGARLLHIGSLMNKRR